MEDSSKSTNFMHDSKLDYFLSGRSKEKTNELRTNSEEFNEYKRDTAERNWQQQLQQEQHTSVIHMCTSMRTCIIFSRPNVANKPTNKQHWGLLFQLLLFFILEFPFIQFFSVHFTLRCSLFVRFVEFSHVFVHIQGAWCIRNDCFMFSDAVLSSLFLNAEWNEEERGREKERQKSTKLVSELFVH